VEPGFFHQIAKMGSAVGRRPQWRRLGENVDRFTGTEPIHRDGLIKNISTIVFAPNMFQLMAIDPDKQSYRPGIVQRAEVNPENHSEMQAWTGLKRKLQLRVIESPNARIAGLNVADDIVACVAVGEANEKIIGIRRGWRLPLGRHRKRVRRSIAGGDPKNRSQQPSPAVEANINRECAEQL
jgi:hypothetical protein